MNKLKVFDVSHPDRFEDLINDFVDENLVEIIDVKYDFFEYSGRMNFYAMVLYKESIN